VNDDIGEYGFRVKIVAADVVTWRKVQPLRVVMIPVVFAVHIPLPKLPLQMLCELVGDAASLRLQMSR
jgi:hypothetical protein